MCLYPTIRRNRKYSMTKKNGGVIPAVNDERTLYVPTGCQNCKECRKQKARGWQVRMMEDVRTNTNGKCVTLTFSDEAILELTRKVQKVQKGIRGYELDNAITTLGVRLFTERWRKKFKKAPRHWLITELGHKGTKNVHMHGVIWTDEPMKEIANKWKYGNIWDDKYNWVNEKTVNYLIKYVSKVDQENKEYKPKIYSSEGIGAKYIERKDAKANKYNGADTKEYYTTRTGHKIAMPTYWRNKLYTEEEKEKLWIDKIDKKERYVNGIKIDISNGEEEYYKVLKEAQMQNKRLGYGDNSINWERKIYENQRREAMIKVRIAKAIKKEERAARGVASASGAGE